MLSVQETVQNSKKPIVTAIGHEYDKGDKLLITEVSDLNYQHHQQQQLKLIK